MVKGTEGAGQAPWEGEDVEALIGELFALKNGLLEAQGDQRDAVAAVHPEHVAGATNLVHYVALRQRDVRSLQDRLARMGLSSLGRAESHVMANLDKVLGLLHRLCGRPWSVMSADEPAGYNSARRLLAAHADALLGAAPPACPVRIMVTMPAEAGFSAISVSASSGSPAAASCSARALSTTGTMPSLRMAWWMR